MGGGGGGGGERGGVGGGERINAERNRVYPRAAADDKNYITQGKKPVQHV